MRATLRVPALVLGLGLTGLSVVANFCFGLLISPGPERWLYAFLFAFLDVTKAFLLPWRDAFLAADESSKARAALAAFWVFMTLSFAAEVGLYKTIKGQVASETTTATSTHALIVAPKEKAEARLRQIPEIAPRCSAQASTCLRPRAIIEQDIKDRKIDPIWARSKECANVTLEESRAFCKDYNKADADLKLVAERETLDAIVAQVHRKLLDAQEVRAAMNREADAQATTFGRWLGVSPETASDLLGCLIALLVEAGSILPLWFAYSSTKQRQEWPIPAAPEAVLTVPVADTAAAPLSEAAPVEPSSPPLTGGVDILGADDPPVAAEQAQAAAQHWFDRCVLTKRGGYVTASELHSHLEAWCKAHGEPALDKTQLGIFMRKRGHPSVKKCGGMRYEGIALAPVGKATLRVAADNTGTRAGWAA